jgi:hypothetical protein
MNESAFCVTASHEYILSTLRGYGQGFVVTSTTYT